MSIDSRKIGEGTVKVLDFPKLMRSTDSGTTILFTTSGSGTVVGRGSGASAVVGKHCVTWSMRYMEDVAVGDGVVLKNVQP